MNLPAKRPERAKFSRIFVGVLIGAGALFFAVNHLALEDLPAALREVSYPWLLLALIAAFGTHVLKALRWRILLEADGFSVPFFRSLQYLLAGQLSNLFVPGRSGDIGRAIVIGSQGAGKLFALGTVILEKALDTVFFALLVSILVLQVPLPPEINLNPQTWVGFAVLISVLLYLSVRFWDQLSKLILRIMVVFPERFQVNVRQWLLSVGGSWQAFQRRRGIIALVSSTIFIWLLNWWTTDLALRSFGLDLPISASLLLLVVLQVGIAVNLVPGTIGLFEYLCVISLAVFAVDQATALGFGIVFHVLIFIPLLTGGVSLFFWNKRSKAETISGV